MKRKIIILSALLVIGIILFSVSVAMSLNRLSDNGKENDSTTPDVTDTNAISDTQTESPDTTVSNNTSTEPDDSASTDTTSVTDTTEDITTEAESIETVDITETEALESFETEALQTEEPPVTTPAVTEPPVTTPPVTEPPATTPAVTEPPVTTPAVTEPPVTTPAVTEPPVTTPPVTKPVETPEPPVETEEVTVEEPEVTIPVIDENARVPAEYSTSLKQAEVYDPADTRKLRVLGVSRSDSDYAAIYGECPIGVTVHVENDHGRFSVISEKGCFAVRICNPESIAKFTITLSYKGHLVGEAMTRSMLVTKSDESDEWAVFIGEENQGFYHKMVPDLLSANLLTNDVIKTATNRWKSRVENLSTVGDGCEIICVLAPSSMTVYPELAPKEALSYAMDNYFPNDKRSDNTEVTRFDQISRLLTDAGVTVIDLRETFRAHKYDALPLYYNYDTHWTTYGSYLAYVELYRYISQKYPAAVPHTFDQFSWEGGYHTGGDIPGYFHLDINGVFEYAYKRTMRFDTVAAVNDLVSYTIPNNLCWNSYSDALRNGDVYDTGRPELPDIYVIRNSYSAALYDLLLERSNRARFQPMFSYNFNIADIQRNDPDYLIYVLSEWNMNVLVEN